MRNLGRILQSVGLLILPFAIASELVGQVALGRSMLIALGGMVLFQIGMALQKTTEGG
ncbi:MAG: hypothetical protein WCJ40_04130 [Planctomycetota bacterium]|nr:hypothetical protein [Planctomycetota bacterium]